MRQLPSPDTSREAYVEIVLRLVEQVPSGRVTTYGAIAEAVGVGGPRRVGWVLSQHGGGVPWWRVVRADGSTPDFLVDTAAAHWRREGTPVRISAGRRSAVDVASCLFAPRRR